MHYMQAPTYLYWLFFSFNKAESTAKSDTLRINEHEAIKGELATIYQTQLIKINPFDIG